MMRQPSDTRHLVISFLSTFDASLAVLEQVLRIGRDCLRVVSVDIRGPKEMAAYTNTAPAPQVPAPTEPSSSRVWEDDFLVENIDDYLRHIVDRDAPTVRQRRTKPWPPASR